jgi:hypothetical protein
LTSHGGMLRGIMEEIVGMFSEQKEVLEDRF